MDTDRFHSVLCYGNVEIWTNSSYSERKPGCRDCEMTMFCLVKHVLSFILAFRLLMRLLNFPTFVYVFLLLTENWPMKIPRELVEQPFFNLALFLYIACNYLLFH